MKRKSLFLALPATLGLMLTGCGTNGTSSGGGSGTVTLNVMSDIADPPTQQVFKDITQEFEKANPNIKVNVSFPASTYENLMKVKMAANNLPDVFDTHGWAKIRYGNYLEDLHTQSWASSLSDNIKPFLTDSSGKVYALPLNIDEGGLLYNADVLKKYNMTPPKTWDELKADGEKLVKESGGTVEPLYFAGVDSWTIGQFFDYGATPLLISPQNNSAQALLNHTFDWSKWTWLPQEFKTFYQEGIINKNVLSAKYEDGAKLFSEGKVAFAMYPAGFATEVVKLNPQAHVGLAPIPSIVPGDEPTFAGGERNTLGVWKDSKHKKEAEEFLDFFAKPDNIKKLSDVTNSPAPLKGIDAGGMFADSYKQYSNIRLIPYFDRTYLPNGMWDVMCTLGQQVLSGSITPAQYSEQMKQHVDQLVAQQK